MRNAFEPDHLAAVSTLVARERSGYKAALLGALPGCSVLKSLAGAGIHGGTVYGASDRIGAYPADRPVRPADLGATLLHLLGIRPETELLDRDGRPFRASAGTPIRPLFA